MRAPIVFGLALAACSAEEQAAPPPAEMPGAELVDCALGGRDVFVKECAVERIEEDGGIFYTVRHPDGGFRRFHVVSDGRGLETADGADDAVITVSGNSIDVLVGEDRYLFPATVEGDDAAE